MGSSGAKRAESHGLIAGHAFSILTVTEAKTLSGGTVKLIQLRNPWANSRQWNGSWSTNHNSWFDYPEVEQHVEEYTGSQRNRQPNGLFWMGFSDFRKHFDEVEACQVDAKLKAGILEKDEL